MLWTRGITNDALQRTEKTRNNTQSTKMKVKQQCFPQHQVARKNICFSLLYRRWGCLAQRNVCDSVTEIPYWWYIQSLHNKSGSHGVPNITLSNFTCLIVDFGKVLCSSANELPQNSNASSREDYIPQILTILLGILRVYIWPLWPFVFCLSFVNNS